MICCPIVIFINDAYDYVQENCDCNDQEQHKIFPLFKFSVKRDPKGCSCIKEQKI